MTRSTLSTVLLAAVALALSACSPPPTAEDVEQAATPRADGEAGTDSASPAPQAAGRLVVARTGHVDQLDPRLATAFQSYQMLELVYDTLLEFDTELQVVPGLEWQPLYLHATTPDEALARVVDLELRYEVGQARRYSDLGFMLLGEIVARETGEPLERHVAGAVHGPLGMTDTGYVPKPRASASRPPRSATRSSTR